MSEEAKPLEETLCSANKGQEKLKEKLQNSSPAHNRLLLSNHIKPSQKWETKTEEFLHRFPSTLSPELVSWLRKILLIIVSLFLLVDPCKSTLSETKHLINHKSIHITQSLNSSLFSAVRSGDVKRVKQLILNGANPGHFDTVFSNITLLEIAIIRGYQEIAKVLIDAGVDLDFVNVNRDGMTPLYMAVREGHQEIAEALIDAGADLNSFSYAYSRMPALHMAIVKDHQEIVKALIDAGADLNLAYDSYALIDGDSYSGTPLHIAIMKGHQEIVKALIDANVNLNSFYGGATPLHIAIIRGHQEIAKILIDAGVDLNSFYDGATPLHIAILEGHQEIVKALIDAGVNLNLTTGNDLTPLHIAVALSHEEIAKVLIDAGVDLSLIADNDMSSLLNMAVRSGYQEIVKALIDTNVDLNLTTDNGLTLLHIAVEEGHEEIAKVLIDAGVDLNLTTDNGVTPLHTAAALGYTEIVKYLINNGSKPGMKDSEGYTAYDYASSAGLSGQIMNLLRQQGPIDIFLSWVWSIIVKSFLLLIGFLGLGLLVSIFQGTGSSSTSQSSSFSTKGSSTNHTQTLQFCSRCGTRYKNYWKILQVPKDSDLQTIRSAYRRLATNYHPDANKDSNAEEKFKEIAESYNILSDPNRRSRYISNPNRCLTCGHDPS